MPRAPAGPQNSPPASGFFLKPPACERDSLCRKWVSVQTITTEVNLRFAVGADAQEVSGLMRKLSDFPDDRTEEAEAADRPPGTPSAHERQPPAARVSAGAPDSPPIAGVGAARPHSPRAAPAAPRASVNTPFILDVHDRYSRGWMYVL